MITIKTFVFNSFQENTYVLFDGTNECVIIDAGCYNETEKKKLQQFIAEKHLKPVHLLNTHGHIDHILGNYFIEHEFGLKTEAHPDDASLYGTVADYGAMFGLIVNQTTSIGIPINEGQEISFGHSILKVIHVPGHSPGGIAFYCMAENFVITGDTLFYGSIGRTDLPGGDYKIIENSIRSKLYTLPDNTDVYPGHGPATSIGYEKVNNPYVTG